MKVKKMLKRTLAIGLAGCLCVPVLNCVDFGRLFKPNSVEAATKIDLSTISVEETPDGNYIKRTYFQKVDYNGDGDFNDEVVEFIDINGNGMFDKLPFNEIVDKDGDGRIFLGNEAYRFPFTDTNPDGVINADDVVSADPEMKILVELVDKNGDGKIDYNDDDWKFSNDYYKGEFDLNHDGIINEYWDVDGNGVIGPNEYVDVNHNGVLDASPKIVDYEDLNGDGVISEYYFVGDLNGNGVCDVNEIFSFDFNGNGKIDGGIVTEACDLNGNGIKGETLREYGSDISKNPGSSVYTAYRKAEYYRTGNVNAPGVTPTYDNHAGDFMNRYEATGERKSSLKSYVAPDNQNLGSDENPIVILEIVPDEMAAQFSMYFGGQEIFDLTYLSMNSDLQPNGVLMGTYQTSMPFLSKEIIPNAGNSYGDYAGGVYYNKNTFMKDVFGFGYEGKNPGNAPLVDNYRFCGWYVGDAAGNGLYEPNLYDNKNLLYKISDFNGLKSKAGSDLYLYAKWQYILFAGSNAETVPTWIDAPYAGITCAEDVVVEGRNTDLGYVDLAGRAKFDKVTFRMMKPSGKFTGEFWNKPGTSEHIKFTDISVTAEANISFVNDYDFMKSGVLGKFIPVTDSLNGHEYQFPYPSLMGNADYGIKSSGFGNCQVVAVNAMEFRKALEADEAAGTTTNQQRYRDLLTNVDMIVTLNKQYAAMYTPMYKFIEDRANKDVNVAKNVMRKATIKTLDDAKIESAFNNKFLTNAVLSSSSGGIDIEGYAVEQMFFNMAGANSKKSIVPILLDSTGFDCFSGGSDSNYWKLALLAVMNEDAHQIYEDWYLAEPPRGFSIVKRANENKYPGSKTTLSLRPFATTTQLRYPAPAETVVDWEFFSVIPSPYYCAMEHMISSSVTSLDPTAEDKFIELYYKKYVSATTMTGGYTDPITGEAIPAPSKHRLTYNAMTYEGDRSIMQSLLEENYKPNPSNELAYDYLENIDKSLISGVKVTTGLGFRFMFHPQNKVSDEIVIVNAATKAYSGVTRPVYYVKSTDVAKEIDYYIKTTDGTQYAVEYYKLSNDNMTDPIKFQVSGNKVRITDTVRFKRITLTDNEGAAVTSGATLTYKLKDASTSDLDKYWMPASNYTYWSVINCDGTEFPKLSYEDASNPGSTAAGTLENALLWEKPDSSLTDGIVMGKAGFGVDTSRLMLAPEGTKEIYLIYAHNKNSSNDIFKFVVLEKKDNGDDLFDLD